MKKILVLLSLLSCLYLLYAKEYNADKDMIRFRVIAASNSSRDIMMKELVVKELSKIIFIKSDDKEEIRKNIYDNLELMEKRINNIFKINDYNETFNISYGLNKFPQKEFLGKKYKAGTYESLVIEIGSAKGNNYFCVLYPSLCIIDYDNKESEKSIYKFKIVDIFNDIF